MKLLKQIAAGMAALGIATATVAGDARLDARLSSALRSIDQAAGDLKAHAGRTGTTIPEDVLAELDAMRAKVSELKKQAGGDPTPDAVRTIDAAVRQLINQQSNIRRYASALRQVSDTPKRYAAAAGTKELTMLRAALKEQADVELANVRRVAEGDDKRRPTTDADQARAQKLRFLSQALSLADQQRNIARSYPRLEGHPILAEYEKAMDGQRKDVLKLIGQLDDWAAGKADRPAGLNDSRGRQAMAAWSALLRLEDQRAQIDETFAKVAAAAPVIEVHEALAAKEAEATRAEIEAETVDADAQLAKQQLSEVRQRVLTTLYSVQQVEQVKKQGKTYIKTGGEDFKEKYVALVEEIDEATEELVDVAKDDDLDAVAMAAGRLQIPIMRLEKFVNAAPLLAQYDEARKQWSKYEKNRAVRELIKQFDHVTAEVRELTQAQIDAAVVEAETRAASDLAMFRATRAATMAMKAMETAQNRSMALDVLFNDLQAKIAELSAAP